MPSAATHLCTALLLAALLLCACDKAPQQRTRAPANRTSPSPRSGNASGGTPERFTRGWSGWDDPHIGCIPRGAPLQLRGKLQPEPPNRGARGKTFEGTRLVLENGESLVVAYGATEQHRRLAGKPVIARGRYCDKQKQALAARHFHIEEVVVLPP